jgi:ABC-type nitrate/sulfonate/bicarbonate transport system substrate-binding protein
VGREDVMDGMSATVQAFLSATAEGYKLAAQNPEESAKIVCEVAKHKGIDLNHEIVRESAELLAPAFLTAEGSWGCMESARWTAFTAWLTVCAAFRV